MIYELARRPLPSPVSAHIVGDWVELWRPGAPRDGHPLITISRETFEQKYKLCATPS